MRPFLWCALGCIGLAAGCWQSSSTVIESPFRDGGADAQSDFGDAAGDDGDDGGGVIIGSDDGASNADAGDAADPPKQDGAVDAADPPPIDAGHDGGPCTLVTHNDGEGQSWQNCTPLGAYSGALAMQACTAYALAQGKTSTACTDGWGCQGSTVNDVCYTTNGTTCGLCWGYTAGTNAGQVLSCSCPATQSGSYD